MSEVLLKAKSIYYAEGIDSLMCSFDALPIKRIEQYVELAREELKKKYSNFKVV